MKKRMRMLAVILSLFIAIGVVELMSKAIPGCSCFWEARAVEICQNVCNERGARCVGVLPWPPAAGCSCWVNTCHCDYRIFCNDYSYGYGHVAMWCPDDCVPY